MDENKPTPGAAIGSFIVIAILIAGAVYILGGELTKTPPSPDQDEIDAESTTTLSEDEYLDLLHSTSSTEASLTEEDINSI